MSYSDEVRALTFGAPLDIFDDYGPLEEGVSNARYVRASNGQEYIAKSPAFNPAQPYVASNELIAAALARALGIPILDYCLLRLPTGQLAFGSAWMQATTFRAYRTAIPSDLESLANGDVLYLIAAFDIWIVNIDRKPHNRHTGRPHPR